MLEEIIEMLEDMGILFDYIFDDGERIAIMRAHCSHNAVLFEAETISELYTVVKKKKDEE